MTLSDLASLGSFVNGAAVLASLIFLYFQITRMTEQVKQAEKNQRAALDQGYIARATETLKWLSEPSINELHARVRTGDTEFTTQELLRLSLTLRNEVLGAQDAYLQHKSGLIDAMTLDNSLLTLRTWLAQPAYRALWMSMAPTVAREFVAVIDTMLTMPVAQPDDLITVFKANLARVGV